MAMSRAVPSSGASQLKKARSVDAPFGDMRTLHEGHNNMNAVYAQNSLPRAKSDFNINANISGESSVFQSSVLRVLT